MRYIKIRGKNYNEVMMKLKMDHGDDAIPISHKFVKEGGILNSLLFAKEVVELTAGVQERKVKPRPVTEKKKFDYLVGDSDKEKPVIPARQEAEVVEKKENVSAHKSNMESLTKTIESVNRNLAGFNVDNNESKMSYNESGKTSVVRYNEENKNKQNKADVIQNSDHEKKLDEMVNSRFEKELEEIKRAIYRLNSDKGMFSGEILSEEDMNLKPFVEILKNNDFEDEESKVIIEEMKNSISRDDLKDRYKIEKSLKDLLRSRIVTTGPIKTNSKKNVIMFIGPTGVGKTTTMAKLGAINSLREGHKVAFVTIDNYRIAATEQLKKYAEIMNIPVYAVNNQKEFKEIITNDDADIIMVDTSGRSHRNDIKISEIKSFAEILEYDVEKMLCVSANTKKNDLDDVFKAFSTIHFNSVVITKVDETSFVGNVVNIADKYNKPISYYTNGQEVPNDIVVADPDKIVDMMIGNIYN